MPRRKRDRRESPEIWAPVLLVCEGADDCYFFDALRSLLGIPERVIQIETFGPDADDGGKDWMPEYLNVLETRQGFGQLHALGVVRDADTSAVSALASVTGNLSASNYVGEFVHGAISPAVHPDNRELRVGVFVMPDGRSTGALEDLYVSAIRETSTQTLDHAIACADSYVECFDPERDVADSRREKMRLYAWLSSRERPSVRPGQALHWNYVDFRCAAFEHARKFLEDLVAAAGEPNAPPV